VAGDEPAQPDQPGHELMTFDELVTAVRDRCGLSVDDKQFTTSVLGRFVNQALHDTSRGDRPWLRRTLSIATTGASSYTAVVPANMDRTVDAAISVAGVKRSLAEVRAADIDAMPAAGGTPECFAISGTTVKVWPAPLAASTITIDVLVRETDLAGAQVPLLPAQFHGVIVARACALVHRAKGNVTEAEVQEQAAAAGMAEIAAHATLSATTSVPATGSGELNVARMVELVYDEVGARPTSADVPPSLVRRAVARAALEVRVHPRAPWLHGSTTFTTAAGTAAYTPAALTTARATLSLVAIDRRSLDQISEAEMADRPATETGEPLVWAWDGPSVRLWPVPNGSYDVKVTYALSERDLVDDDDEPLLPASHRMAIVYRAAAIVLRRLGKPAEAAALDGHARHAERDIQRDVAHALGTPTLQRRSW
jgi:hypothetical protein